MVAHGGTNHIDEADAAFKIWRAIRNETLAQDYLLSLLTGRS